MDREFVQSPEFRNWLARQEGDVLATLAERISLRGAPMWLARIAKGYGYPREPMYTPYLRSLITTSALRLFPGDETLQRLSLKAGARAKIYLDTGDAFYPAAAVLSYSDDSTYNHDEAAYDTYSAPGYGGRWAMDDVVEDVITIANREWLPGQRLWRTSPFLAEEAWHEVRSEWAKQGETFSFWQRWYEAALLGIQPDPSLPAEVALIPDEVWEAGPGAVAEAIAQIEIPFAIARTPNAEVISINPETGLIRADPVSHLSAKHLADIVDTLLDAAHIFDGHGGPNGPYAALEGECRIVEDACARYAHRPVMLLRISRRVVERVTLKEKGGDCPKNDALVRDFVTSLAGVSGDLMAFDPDVREAETARAATRQTPPPAEIAQTLVEAADRSAEISEGELNQELPVAARVAVGPEASADQQLAMYETKSRLLRILVLTSGGAIKVRDGAKKAIEWADKHPVVYGAIIPILLFLLS
ncbi:MAG: hypothetical protein R3D56_09830 [Paracoccaceae bacterium]